MPNKLLFLEFNEICIDLIDSWINEGKLPNFSKLRNDSMYFNTLSDEHTTNLEPWIQWHSIHVGKSYNTHKVFELTDGTRCKFENIWQAIKDEGHNVASIGSMNVRAFTGEECAYIPDPWCNSEKSHPEELQQPYDFISQSVIGHSSNNKNSVSDNLKILLSLWKNGLSSSTILQIVKQLTLQKFNYKKHSWKSATLLDLIQLDLAKKVIEDKDPKFISFFSNSVAHFQHAYWRYLEPEKFSSDIGKENYNLYKDAIYYGYSKLDQLLGKFIKIAEKHNYKLVVCSALSQRPYLAYENSGGRHYYRLKDELSFLSQLDIDANQVEIYPIMAQQYKLTVKDPTKTDYYVDLLSQVKMANEDIQVFDVTHEENGIINFGSQIFSALDDDAEIVYKDKRIKFFDSLYKMEDIKSGEHDPSGLLFLPRDVSYTKQPETIVSILDITPTLLDIFGVKPSNKFKVTCEGQSLVSN